MSTPASAMALTARGFIPCFSMPAEWASSTSPFSCRVQPSAIWLRQELPVHRNRIFFFIHHFRFSGYLPICHESPNHPAEPPRTQAMNS